MPHPCVVCGRSRMNLNNRQEEYMFFGFPVKDEPRCRRWLEFCGREDLYKLTKKQLLQRMVCSKHFQPQDFLADYWNRIYITAVPSVYDPKQSLYNITCVLCGRARKDPPPPDYDGTTFHHFPGEEFRCLKWLDFVGIDSYYRLTRKEILFCYICSKHFDRSQFVPGFKGRLVDNAIPSIRNPDEVDQSEQSINELQTESQTSLFDFTEKYKRLEPLSTEVLESQACAACGRLRSDPKNKIEHYKFHPFPAYEIGRCLRWCQFLGREDLLKMSPNQIRKLVLCSKHFQTDQNFHKLNPCNAVPTIRDISEPETVAEQNEDDQDLGEDSKDPSKAFKRFSRPLVSSKKPKIDNKPTPLAKKRGKSRRPTSINIPRPDFTHLENRVIKKLPLPPNWKTQLGHQFQSVAVNNVASNVTNNIQGGIKKIIVPFTGDISTLGTPIPVHSLSSIPPGLLIKINLPEQEQQQQQQQQQKSSTIKKRNKTKNLTNSSSKQQIWVKDNNQTSIILQNTNQNVDKSLVELLSISPEPVEENLNSNEEEIDLQEEKILPQSLEILEDKVKMQVNEEQYFEAKNVTVKRKKTKRRKRITGTMRRTMIPLRNEIQYFLRKMRPLLHRLPNRARAMVKLSIVNMVIDQL
ncbi:uncharacterized protein [Linepithema humile]|uniref:uncharacterized protein n=1 Tax=Linepithema humile TaxID=83485 RepID=UPI0006232348|nr:PREDICTED: uncharacterized protein LOC105673411 [Linepithema humile]